MFLVLAIAWFALLHLPFFRQRKLWDTFRERGAWALGLSLFTAGGLHVSMPELFVPMVPDYMRSMLSPTTLVYGGGFALLASSLGVVWRRVRSLASYGVIGMLAAFLPANLHVAQNGAQLPYGAGELPPDSWLAWSSVPMQFVYMGWAWLVGRRR
jgi:uncharacterized membrane protein